MYIDNFIWLPDVAEKIAVKHQVTEEEAEEVFFNRPHFRFIEYGYEKGEDIYSASGQTAAGRYLIVFFIYKSENTALILSARDMDKTERKRYEQR
ncbi:MAG: BrnT family toxin [candidate division KSB1 bacterium]|nr:BrnT family toxin [candidate division KSB1 bacterium]MDZ7336788.1 BrnT family toxin [candidate division KSB1 bacterium]